MRVYVTRQLLATHFRIAIPAHERRIVIDEHSNHRIDPSSDEVVQRERNLERISRLFASVDINNRKTFIRVRIDGGQVDFDIDICFARGAVQRVRFDPTAMRWINRFKVLWRLPFRHCHPGDMQFSTTRVQFHFIIQSA